MRFQDKVVFVTGGAKGLGKAMVKAFVEEGAHVAVNGRNKEALSRFEEEFKAAPVRAFNVDVTDYEATEAMLKKVVDEWGRVDVLVNNAGIVNPLSPAEKLKKEVFDQVIDINLKGVFYTTQIFGKQMIEQGQGRIINISSQVGLFGEKGFLPYAISKNALNVMARSLAHEWSRYGVTLVSVAPGYIRGGMNEAVIRKEALVDYLSKRAPLGRMGNVEDLVATVLFLASPEAQFINGETVVMDGGMTGYIQQPFLDVIMKGK